ncbi:hypothetical protein U746_0341 [Mycolicibacterium mucogenicum 261Sha1.1M5]|nr:hypothetical protein U746_0341 [Mycolicibacterium mucogenicum 261Sha1.1M5]
MNQVTLSTSQTRRGTQSAFWAFAGIGVLVLAVTWAWYGLAIHEEASEQGKAEAAGTTMAGFAAMVGGVPLVLAHLVGVVLLSVLGWRTWRAVGLAYTLLSVTAASLLGLGAAQFLFGGNLFYTDPVFIP